MLNAFIQIGFYLPYDVLVVRVALHRGRVALLMHEAHGAAALRHRFEGAGRPQRLHVIDHGRAGLEHLAHHSRAPRVDGYAEIRDFLEHRQDPVELLLLGDRLGAWPRRLAAQVDDVRAFSGETARVSDRLVGAQEAAAVGKGIRRDVHYAHQQGLLQIKKKSPGLKTGRFLRGRASRLQASARSRPRRRGCWPAAWPRAASRWAWAPAAACRT